MKVCGYKVEHLVMTALWLLLTGCDGLKGKEHVLNKTRLPRVMVTPVTESTLADEVVYPVLLASNHEVEVVSEVEGLVSNRVVQIGDFVKKGQQLLSIRNPDPLLDYKAYIVRAPISGHIAQLRAEIGNRVTTGAPLLTLVDSGSIKLRAHILPDDLGLIAPGTRGIYKRAQESYHVRVRALSQSIDPKSGTAECEIEFLEKPKSQTLMSGLIGKVFFQLNPRKGIEVEDRSLFYKDRKPHVIVIDQEARAAYVPVEILRTHNGVAEIKSDLKPGARIVTYSSSYISDQEKVVIEEEGRP